MSLGIPLDKTKTIDILKGYCGIKAQHPAGHTVFITQKEVDYYTKLGYEIIIGDRAAGVKHDQDKPHMNKYDRPCKGITIDVYDVLQAFNVDNPALQHLIKKALCSGLRGHKDRLQDVREVLESAKRAVELEESKQ